MKVAINQLNISSKNRESRSSIIPIPPSDKSASDAGQTKTIAFLPNRFSIEKLRAIWNDDEDYYTDDELLQIRDWFYTVAEVAFSTIALQKTAALKAKSNNPSRNPHTPIQITIPVHNHTESNEAAEESYSLHPRIYRRAS